ncbi:MAG: hypothetical protein IJB96_08530 [Lachnospira sp.]|nr:hypothetical protein [Lachnospira sp.]
MWLKASFTVENSVIVPVFVMILILFIMVTFDMHDSVVARSIDLQVAMKFEQEMIAQDKSKKGQVLSRAVTNTNIKCILDGKVSETAIDKRIEEEKIVTENRQPDFVRLISAGLKLKDDAQ